MHAEPPSLGALEPEQLANATQAKLPRRVLGRGTLALLILLRVYVLAAIPIVAYAFFHALEQHPIK